MSVYQKKDGRWFCIYYKDGKQKWESFGRGKNAEQNAREKDAELHPEKKQDPPGPRLIDIINAYIKSKTGISAQSTIDDQKYKFKRTILPRLNPGLKCMSLNSERVTDYVKRRREDGVKDVTINTEITHLKAALNWAADPDQGNMIPYNPIAKVKKPKRDDARVPPPSIWEIERIIKNSADHLTRAIIISYYTGIRPGTVELLTLTWRKWVDFNNNRLHVISAKKGGLVERYIPISKEFRKILKEWHTADKGKGNIIHYKGESIKSLKTAWKNAKKRAGITRRLRMYDLRHAFATTALNAGEDLKAVSRLLGHSRPDTTLRVYQHTSTASEISAVESVPAVKIVKPDKNKK